MDSLEKNGPPARILIVDDEPAVLRVLTQGLQAETYEITSTTSPETALELLARDEFDLVISDERMPGMSGHEFLALVAQRYPETVRILLTGYPNLDCALHVINEGHVFRLLTKPWNDIELELTLREAVFHRRQLLAGRERIIAEEMQAPRPPQPG